MKRRIDNNSTYNPVQRFMKTPTCRRGTYVYRFTDEEKEGLKTRKFIEEIELVPGEDGVAEEEIKALHAADDSTVYYNIKACRPKRTAADKEKIEAWKAEYIRNFEVEHGYKPHPKDVTDAADKVFPKNWCLSLDGILEYDDDDTTGSGDKSLILATNCGFSDSVPTLVEAMDEIAATWSESWREIYERVLKNGESIVSIARERGVTEGAVRKTLNKIRKVLGENPDLKKYIRYHD